MANVDVKIWFKKKDNPDANNTTARFLSMPRGYSDSVMNNLTVCHLKQLI